VRAHLARRLLLAVPTLLVLSFLIFALISAAPGDPATEYALRTVPGGNVTPAQVAHARHQLGLDRPFIGQYTHWVAAAVHGDLGRSFYRQTSVAREIRDRLGATGELAGAALLITIVLAIPLGVAGAAFHRKLGDHVLRVFSLLGASTPSFFLAYVLIIVFAVHLKLLPVAGRQSLNAVVLPAITLAVGPTALVARLLRSSMLEALSENYIVTAYGKGLRRLRVLVRHGLGNAVIPVVTVFGSIIGTLLEGAIIVEVVFAWPGLGRLVFEAISERDYPLVEGLVLFAGVVYVVVNLLVDLSYAALDPRISAAASL
jgi:peptide/nickel transport system permease protein